ncbi:MAG: glycosyltransferase [Actinomycetota bacterium]
MPPLDTSLRRSASEATKPQAEFTSVMLVLVATNGARWLPHVIEGIKAQTIANLDVIAVDNASNDSSRAMLDKAFGRDNVVVLKRRSGYARALANGLKAAGERATTARAFLFVHDDCAMNPDCIERLLETFEYEDVGIAGPKLVDWDNPEMLQEAGLSIDRFGRAFNPLERGELDQGQHDRLRETMWVSSACMVVSREVIERVGLFDNRYVVLGEDLDLCWRARVCGFKVAFSGEARARHAAASIRDEREGYLHGRSIYFIERNLLASVLKNYSVANALVAFPVALAIALANAIAKFIMGKRSDAAQIFEAVRWNLVHLPGTLRARHRVQTSRRTTDSEVMRNATRGANRVRTLAERGFERIAGDPALGVEEAEGLATPEEHVRKRVRDRIRAHPVGSAAVALTILYVIGSRALWRSGGLAGIDMPPSPAGPSDFFRSFFSGWRSAGVGSAGAAPTAHFLSGLMSLVTFARPGLAQRLFVGALVPIAGLSASKFAARVGCGTAARRVAAFAYALSPLALWALGEGRLSDLVLIASAPGLCIPLLRASELTESNGWRGFLLPVLGCAIATAFSPWTVVFMVLAGIGFAAGCLASGNRDRALYVLITAIGISVSTMLLLFPWSIELFRHGSALGLGGSGLPERMENLVRLTPGARHATPIILATAFPLAGAVGFFVASRTRTKVARALAIAAGAGLVAAWAIARGAPWIGPRASLPLSLYAVCVCALIGLGADQVLPTLRGRQFGGSQIGTTLVALALVAGVGAGGLWLVKGTRPGLVSSGSLTPASLEPDRQQLGEYRLLWVSGSVKDIRVSLAPPSGVTMTSYAERSRNPGDEVVDKLVAGIIRGTVDSVGRQLATFGVRFVFLRDASPQLIDAFIRQSDLEFRQTFSGSTVLENTSWLPNGVALSAGGWELASRAPLDQAPAAIAGAEPNPGKSAGFKQQSPDVLTGSAQAGAKIVLLAESFDPRWSLEVPAAHKNVGAERSFGWANAFSVPSSGKVALVWGGQGIYHLLLFIQFAMLIGLAFVVSRQVALERGER